MGHLTHEEQQQLLKYLPLNDTTVFPDRSVSFSYMSFMLYASECREFLKYDL